VRFHTSLHTNERGVNLFIKPHFCWKISFGVGFPSEQIECDKSSDVNLICIAIKIGLQTKKCEQMLLKAQRGIPTNQIV